MSPQRAGSLQPGPQPVVAPYASSLRPLSQVSSSVTIMSPQYGPSLQSGVHLL